jgi:hypothetical protein
LFNTLRLDMTKQYIYNIPMMDARVRVLMSH